MEEEEEKMGNFHTAHKSRFSSVLSAFSDAYHSQDFLLAKDG